jgi:hypothetical protein
MIVSPLPTRNAAGPTLPTRAPSPRSIDAAMTGNTGLTCQFSKSGATLPGDRQLTLIVRTETGTRPTMGALRPAASTIERGQQKRAVAADPKTRGGM